MCHHFHLIGISGEFITFSNISNAVEDDIKRIPDGYKDFNWTNIFYVHLKYAEKQQSKKSSLINAFHTSSCSPLLVAVNTTISGPMIMRCTSARTAFNLRAFEANSIYQDKIQLVLTGRRNRQQVGTATFTLLCNSQRYSVTNACLDGIDELEFTTQSASSDTYSSFSSEGRCYLFALTCLSLWQVTQILHD